MLKYILVIIFSTSSFATNLSYESTFHIETTNSKEDVLERIFDYKNFCKKNCIYYMPSVEEMIILKDYDYGLNSFYTWTFINDFMNSTFFSIIEISRDEESILITQRQVNENLSRELSVDTGLENSPLLDSTLVNYKITREEGFLRVSYFIKISFSKTILRISKSKIKKGLKKTAKAIESNLRMKY